MNHTEVPALSALMAIHFPELTEGERASFSSFYGAVLRENEVQNITRLTSPEDFLFGHILDCVSLRRSDLVEFPAMDLGSGLGVPGIGCAFLGMGPWILAESERRKAEFLSGVIQELKIEDVSAFSGRGEKYLESGVANSVVARAVGPVERIFSWIKGCSTWNNLILFKGPAWDEEWKSFCSTEQGRKLILTGEYAYEAGPEKKQRRIIRLDRLPLPK